MHGISNIEVKRMNKNSILKYMLRSEALPKNSIADDTHLSIPTVAQILKELEEIGLIKEEGMLESIGGRKAKSYRCIKDAKVAVGVDITGNHINIVLIDLAKQIVYSKRVRFRLMDKQSSYLKLKSILMEAIIESGISQDKILGWGISLPAIIDKTGCKIFGMHEQLEISYQLYDIVKDWFSFPVILENDANSAGKAEVGLSGTDKDTIYFFISQSVGGAIIIDGQVFYGKSQRGGEIGHITLFPNGRPCYCGRTGCFNAYCSTKILSDTTDEDLGKFFDNLKLMDKKCLDIWEEYLDYLALAVHDINTVFDSEIIIGGYLGQYMNPYMDDLKKRVQKIDTFLTDTSFIKQSVLKYEASAIGVAAVFIERFIENI